jgi:hypothetical protein
MKGYVFNVAQVSNLLYRGLPVGKAALKVGNLRYGRLEICATLQGIPPAKQIQER